MGNCSRNTSRCCWVGYTSVRRHRGSESASLSLFLILCFHFEPVRHTEALWVIYTDRLYSHAADWTAEGSRTKADSTTLLPPPTDLHPPCRLGERHHQEAGGERNPALLHSNRKTSTGSGSCIRTQIRRFFWIPAGPGLILLLTASETAPDLASILKPLLIIVILNAASEH